MRIVGIRELKDRLSEYIRLVRRDERILVSNRGEIVAELRPSYGTVSDARAEPGLVDLAGAGRLRLARARGSTDYPEQAPLLREGASRRLLDAERGDR